MRTTINHPLTVLSSVGLAIATGLLPFTQIASADVLARGHGRCKLTQQTFVVFDGYCVVKQKQQGGTTIFAVEMDNGSRYNFFGPSKQSLQVQTYDGVRNVRFTEEPDKGVFVWEEGGSRNRLSVKLDTMHDAQVSHDSPKTAVGTVLGAAVGAVIGNLLSGGRHHSRSATSPASAGKQPDAGTTVSTLSDLVGARAGQAENTVRERGYQFVKGAGGYTFWLEGKTNYCVAIRTEEGRYQSITYAGNSIDCQR